MSTPTIFADAQCLDRHLRQRFRAFFGGWPASPRDMSDALALWQWEMLGRTLLHATTNSLHYRVVPGAQRAVDILRQAAQASGLPVFQSRGVEHDPTRGWGIGDSGPRSQFSSEVSRHILSSSRRSAGEAARQATAMTVQALPGTLPSQLAENCEAFLAVGHGDVHGLISLPTSGTTGGPGKRIFCTESDLAHTSAFFQHGMRFMVGPGRHDHVALLMSGERPGSVGDLLVKGMTELGVSCSVPGFVAPAIDGEAAMLHRLATLRPTCLVGVPAQLMRLARSSEAGLLRGMPHSVLLSGDAVTAPMRQAIAEGFGCEVFLHYGLTETGLGGAVECCEHAGCHIREADLLIEISDPDGRALTDGQWGEITMTTLTRQAMPLLRYSTGDEGRIIPEPCACGGVTRLLQVRGRISESILVPDGSRVHSTELDTVLYELPFILGYDATFHQGTYHDSVLQPAKHLTGSCLVLALHLAEGAPDNAILLAQERVCCLRGLRPIPELTISHCSQAYLPVIIHTSLNHSQTFMDDGALIRRQAKQHIARSTSLPLSSKMTPERERC